MQQQNTTLTHILLKETEVLSKLLIGNLNINGHRILNLRTPRSNSEVATKKYADDNKVDGNGFLKLGG